MVWYFHLLLQLPLQVLHTSEVSSKYSPSGQCSHSNVVEFSRIKGSQDSHWSLVVHDLHEVSQGWQASLARYRPLAQVVCADIALISMENMSHIYIFQLFCLLLVLLKIFWIKFVVCLKSIEILGILSYRTIQS